MTEDHNESVQLFCNLSALDVTQRKRRSLLDQLLQVGTVAIVELPDAYVFHVDPASVIAQHLEEFAALERVCCPFLTIAVGAGTECVPAVLTIGGGDAVKEFISAEFGIRRRPTP